MHIILLNGPPRSGKDTVGEIIRKHFGTTVVDKFARILKERTHALYGLFDNNGKPWEHDSFEFSKDSECNSFDGGTPRNAYIAVSEKLLKPLHGENVFGELLASSWLTMFDPLHTCNPLTGTFVITDCGFEGEIEELIKRFPYAQVSLISIHRKGCDFSNDSRSYIRGGEETVPEALHLSNDGSLEELCSGVASLLHKHLGFPEVQRYALEVQLPTAGDAYVAPEWVVFSQAEDSDQSLAKAQTVRDLEYDNRVIRITDRFSQGPANAQSRYIYPDDPAVYHFGIFSDVDK